MLDNLSSSKESPLKELLEDNDSLGRKNRVLTFGLIGLSALSLLSMNSCSKNANALSQSRTANSYLRHTLTEAQKKAADLSAENAQLKDYVEDAQDFARGIRPWYDENDSGCDNTNCVACQQMEKENKQKFVAFTNAIQTLNINPKKLARLQKGLGE